MSTGALQITLADVSVQLDPRRALVWEDHLIIADLHLDKAGAFQRAGVAVPLGDDGDDLQRISALCADHGCREVIVVGDFVHAAPTAGGAAERLFERWHAAHPQLGFTVVAGNHDRHGWQALRRWPLSLHAGDLQLGPFLLRHDPQPQAGAYVIGGHLHPVAFLSDGRRDRLRVPVFQVGAERLVLPGFGSFTGGARVVPSADERLFAVLPDRVVAMAGAAAG